MSDTQKDLTTLLAALTVNNGTGAIVAQNIRDLLVSVLGGYGSCFVDAGVGSQGTIPSGLPMGQFASLGPASGVTINAGAGQATVGVAGDYYVECRCEFVGVSAHSYTLTCGTGLIGTTQVNAAADRTAVAFAGIVTLTANQTLTLKASDPSSGSFAVKTGHWLVKRVG